MVLNLVIPSLVGIGRMTNTRSRLQRQGIKEWKTNYEWPFLLLFGKSPLLTCLETCLSL